MEVYKHNSIEDTKKHIHRWIGFGGVLFVCIGAAVFHFSNRGNLNFNIK